MHELNRDTPPEREPVDKNRIANDMDADLQEPMDGCLPASPAGGTPGPALMQVDFRNPQHLSHIAPEVVAFLRSIGAVSATVNRVGDEDHAQVRLQRGVTQNVNHPDIKRIKYANVIEFTLRQVQVGGLNVLEISGINGVELDVGLFFAWAKPSAATIKPDGSFEAEATAMGIKARKGGVAPHEVVELVQKSMDSFDRLRAALP